MRKDTVNGGGGGEGGTHVLHFLWMQLLPNLFTWTELTWVSLALHDGMWKHIITSLSPHIYHSDVDTNILRWDALGLFLQHFPHLNIDRKIVSKTKQAAVYGNQLTARTAWLILLHSRTSLTTCFEIHPSINQLWFAKPQSRGVSKHFVQPKRKRQFHHIELLLVRLHPECTFHISLVPSVLPLVWTQRNDDDSLVRPVRTESIILSPPIRD